MNKLALYFGCAGPSSGHAIHDGDSSYIQSAGAPWTIEQMDTGLLKNMEVFDRTDGRVHWTCGGKDVFWYAFVWWDRSADSRGNSNSGFYVRGFEHRQAREAFEYACETWPKVVNRQAHPLVLVER